MKRVDDAVLVEINATMIVVRSLPLDIAIGEDGVAVVMDGGVDMDVDVDDGDGAVPALPSSSPLVFLPSSLLRIFFLCRTKERKREREREGEITSCGPAKKNESPQ